MTPRTRLLVAALVALVGAVWIGQGFGVIGGGFMVGNMFWAYVGALLIGLALVYAAWPRFRHR